MIRVTVLSRIDDQSTGSTDRLERSAGEPPVVIVRRWHGYATPTEADEYERRLTEEILPAATDIDGYRGHEVLRRDGEDRVEFCTLLRFDSWAAVERFAGPEPERAHVPERAREVLADYDETVTHYERVTDD